MYEPVQQCNACGAGLSLDDLRKPGCPYCNTVYPHRSQAVQHQQMVGQVLGQMMVQQAQIQAQAQAQWQQAMGLGGPPGPPGGPPPGPPGGPPPVGPPGVVPPGVYGDPHALARAQMAHVERMSRNITRSVLVSIVGVFALVGIALAIAMLAG